MNNDKIIIIPIISYPNAEKYKYIIYKQNNKKSGIYRWRNLITKECYVGSAINLKERLKKYFSSKCLKRVLLRNKSKISSSLLKYGYSNFSLEILEYCEDSSLLKREQYYINNINPKYNILKTAGSRLGYKLSYEARKAISFTSRKRKYLNKPEIGWKIRNSNVHKEIKSNTRLKLALRAQGVSVKIFDNSNKFINEFPNIKSAAEFVGVKYSTISKIFDTGISYDNYIYKFKLKDLRIWVYDNNCNLIHVLDNAKITSTHYNIPRSTLSNYIRLGKIYKEKYIFYNISSINKVNSDKNP